MTLTDCSIVARLYMLKFYTIYLSLSFHYLGESTKRSYGISGFSIIENIVQTFHKDTRSLHVTHYHVSFDMDRSLVTVATTEGLINRKHSQLGIII